MTAHYGDLIRFRRPASAYSSAYSDVRTIFYIRPTWATPPADKPRPADRGWSWERQAFGWDWSMLDRLLIPLALVLAAADRRTRTNGTHRRPTSQPARVVAGRSIRSHRAPAGGR